MYIVTEKIMAYDAMLKFSVLFFQKQIMANGSVEVNSRGPVKISKVGDPVKNSLKMLHEKSLVHIKFAK